MIEKPTRSWFTTHTVLKPFGVNQIDDGSEKDGTKVRAPIAGAPGLFLDDGFREFFAWEETHTLFGGYFDGLAVAGLTPRRAAL